MSYNRQMKRGMRVFKIEKAVTSITERVYRLSAENTGGQAISL